MVFPWFFLVFPVHLVDLAASEAAASKATASDAANNG
jgi:hypothetical protein